MLVVGLIVVLFSMSNQSIVSLDLWPFPYSIPMPFYFSMLIALLIGFFGGSIVMWFSSGGSRKKAKIASKKASSLEKDLENLKQKIEELEDKTKL